MQRVNQTKYIYKDKIKKITNDRHKHKKDTQKRKKEKKNKRK